MALLYDDGAAEEKVRAKKHLADCEPCRAQFSSFSDVRSELAAWTLPSGTTSTTSAANAIRSTSRGDVVRGAFGERHQAPAPPPRVPVWASWGLAAAAGLTLGIGLSLTGRGLMERTPSGSPASTAANLTAQPQTVLPVSTASHNALSLSDVQSLLEAREQSHRAEIAELERRLSAALSSPSQHRVVGATTSQTEFDRLLRESEERQARFFEARLAQVKRDAELQRQYDLAQVAAGLAYIDNRTGAEAARTSELMKNLVRVNGRPQQR